MAWKIGGVVQYGFRDKTRPRCLQCCPRVTAVYRLIRHAAGTACRSLARVWPRLLCPRLDDPGHDPAVLADLAVTCEPEFLVG